MNENATALLLLLLSTEVVFILFIELCTKYSFCLSGLVEKYMHNRSNETVITVSTELEGELSGRLIQ